MFHVAHDECDYIYTQDHLPILDTTVRVDRCLLEKVARSVGLP